MFDLSSEFWRWILGQAGILIVAYFGLRQTVAVLSTRHDSLEDKFDDKTKNIEGELKELRVLLIQSARYEERQARADEHIVLIRKELDDLKHGEGWINSKRLANAANPGVAAVP